jgi:hypothetical protein
VASEVPTNVEGVPRELLNPRLAWADKEAFEREVRKLACIFQKAFKLYEDDVKENVRLAGPRVDYQVALEWRYAHSYLVFEPNLNCTFHILTTKLLACDVLGHIRT